MMINIIIDELKILENRYKVNNIWVYDKIIIAYLIYLKYLCDSGEYKYDEVIESNKLYDITYDIKFVGRYFNKCLDGNLLSINRILIKLKDIDIKDLLKEFLNYRDKVIYFHNDKDRILYYNLKVNKYDYYCDKGNATYVINKGYEDNYKAFRAFDEILGIENKYVYDIEIKDYDYVYVYDDIPKYRSRRDNIFDIIFPYIRNNSNVVVFTNYNKISNFSSGRIVSKYIKTIVLYNDRACMLFNYNNYNGDISIINYDDKIGDVDKLYNVICNNRRQRDVLVKISYQDLVDNNMRIGFKLYQIDKSNKIRDINKIVDENTRYLNRLNTINERVEQEINILLNK